jgi:tRNA (cytidine/uridine-2'-O-)-methyltransferase
MVHIVLYQPEIPPNTGNIIRLAANNGCKLHLIEPLGFALDTKKLRRAGLDYHEFTKIQTYQNYQDFLEQAQPRRLIGITTKAEKVYTEMQFEAEDYLLFGPETRGLPEAILKDLGRENCLRIPMLPHSRSLNLSNAVAIITYEAWRQASFQ